MELVLNRISRKAAIITVILLVLVSGVILGKLIFGNSGNNNNSNLNTASFQQVNQEISEDRKNAITKAVEKVSPAIVGINVEEVREIRDPFFNDPFFRQFFGDAFNQNQVVRGLGSGFLITDDGYILTNDHVAGNATKISVTLTSGETVNAKLVGSDPVSDIALLKIDKKNLPYVTLGNSDNLIIGEWAIALGNPFGLFEINDKPTVTVGVVSAVNMKVSAEGNRVYKDMVQTDASINSGNSGGPLLNALGEVIGMNTIIFTGGSYSSGSIGVGFAISINRVKKIMEELKSEGKIERPGDPGFSIQEIDERIAKHYNLKDTKGVFVIQIRRGSNADKAGLRPEDIITEVNGEKIRTRVDIVFAVFDSKKGDVLKMKVLRNGSEEELEMKLD